MMPTSSAVERLRSGRMVQIHTRDVRIEELMRALNDQLLPVELVMEKVRAITGRRVSFYRYRDGTYYLLEEPDISNR